MMRGSRICLWVYTLALVFLFIHAESDKAHEPICIVIVSCGASRAKEALTSMRSAILSTAHRLSFHIFHQADDGNDVFFTRALEAWKEKGAKVEFSFYRPVIPEAYSNLFAPCACQRLFLHQALPETIDRVLYVDTDTIVLDDIANLWSEFNNFTSNTVAALVAEHEASHEKGYYKDDAEHPYYNESGCHGINSGVVLLDIAKLRHNPWNADFERYRAQYKLQYHDQDLLNIYFADHPERLHLLSCEWNFRTDHCYFQKQHCGGIRLLHGNRGVFYKKTDEKFSVQVFVATHAAFSFFPDKELGNCMAIEQMLQWNLREVTKTSNFCEFVAAPWILKRIRELCQKETSDSL